MNGQQINLYRAELDVQRGFPFWGLLVASALFGVLVVAVLVWPSWQHVQGLERELEMAGAERAELEERLRAMQEDPESEQARALHQRLTSLEAELEDLAYIQSRIEEVMAEVSGRGFAGPLRNLAQIDIEEVWLTEITLGPAPATWRFSGRALDARRIPEFIDRLEAELPLIRVDEQHIEIQHSEGERSVEFRLAVPDLAETGGRERQ